MHAHSAPRTAMATPPTLLVHPRALPPPTHTRTHAAAGGGEYLDGAALAAAPCPRRARPRKPTDPPMMLSFTSLFLSLLVAVSQRRSRACVIPQLEALHSHRARRQPRGAVLQRRQKVGRGVHEIRRHALCDSARWLLCVRFMTRQGAVPAWGEWPRPPGTPAP